MNRCNLVRTLFFIAIVSIPHFASSVCLAVDVQGVWRGTVGKQPVMACFDDNAEAHYYYQKSLADLRLNADEKQNDRWVEKVRDVETGKWSIEYVDANSIEGKWLSLKEDKTLSIQLERIPFDKNGSPCQSDAYHEPRLNVKPTIGTPQTFKKIKYRTLTNFDKKVIGLEILEAESVFQSINRSLQADFKSRQMNSFMCDMYGSGGGYGHGYESKSTLDFRNQYFVNVATVVAFDCDGPSHAGIYEKSTYDLKTGKKVDFKSWFKNKEIADELRSTIAKYAKFEEGNNDCKGALDMRPEYSVWLAGNGLVFYPSLHAISGCSKEIVVPFPMVKPFLSKEGVANIQKLMTPSRE